MPIPSPIRATNRRSNRLTVIRLTSISLFVALAVAIAGCIPATPIVVIITPTQAMTATTAPTGTPVVIAPTLQASPTRTLTPTATATATATATKTNTPLPTATVPTTPTVTPTGPTPTFGAIAGPNVNTVTPVPTLPTTATAQQAQHTQQTQPTKASPAPAGPTASGPTVTFGALIGPNYTPPPTFTPGPPPTIAPPANVTLPPAVTAGPSPTPGPVLRSSLMGIQIHGYLKDEEWNRMLAYAKDLGMGWIKVQVQWKELEPAKGVYNDLYRAMIQNVQRARLQGLRTLVSIAKAPGWSRPQAVAGTEDGPPDNVQDFANFVGQFVRDCKPEFIDAIELWNEPNLIREWRSKPLTGAEYMKLFSAGYTAIQDAQKAIPADHRITVITAGPAPTATSGDGTTLNDRDWLQQIYTAGAGKYGADVAIGAHPYGWANPPDATCCTAQAGITGWYEYRSFYFRDTLEDYRKIMLRNNHTAGKLWVTEFGWATYDGLHRSDGSPGQANPNVGWEKLLSAGQQANYVLRAFYMAQQPPFYDYLGPMMLWNLNFGIIPDMINNSREEAGFSLLDINWSPRPIYQMLKNAAKQP